MKIPHTLKKPGLLYIVLGFLILMLSFHLQRFTVTIYGNSMEPTLQSGEQYVVHTGITPKVHDIVVLNYPIDNSLIVKRVYAVGGETIWCVSQVIQDDDNSKDSFVLYEYYKIYPYYYKSSTYLKIYKITLEPDELIVLGDNTAASDDSRFFGPVSLSQIKGVIYK